MDKSKIDFYRELELDNDDKFVLNLAKQESRRLRQTVYAQADAIKAYHQFFTQLIDFILESDPTKQEIVSAAEEARLWLHQRGE